MMIIRKNPWFYLALLLMAMTTGIYLYVSYWVLWPFKVVEYKEIEILHQDEIYQGNTVEFKISSRKNMSLPAKIIIQLINQRVETYAPFESNMPMGETTKIYSVKLSAFTEPGIHYITWTAIYQIHPLRTVVYSITSKPFNVLKRE